MRRAKGWSGGIVAPPPAPAGYGVLAAGSGALSKRRSSGVISDAEYRRQLAELQALRDGHGKATLSQIEGTN